MCKSAEFLPSVGLLTINLDLLAENWLMLSEKVSQSNSSAKCGAVVKADAYGLGMSEVAAALLSKGCHIFFVATLTEGIQLRLALGDEFAVYVFGGLSHGVGSEWVKYSLVPVLFDLEHVKRWVDYSKSLEKVLPCAVKVDTGMHRVGLSLDEFEAFCNDADLLEYCVPNLLMSHLACADEPNHPLNSSQLSQFRRVVKLSESVFPCASLSLANSSGIFLGEEFHYDVVRPGVALYGANPSPQLRNPMSSVVRLQLPIMQTKIVNRGESVGYGASFVATRRSKIAIVFGGYADGLFRALSSSGFAYYNGVKVPIVGRVSMDSLVFDITDLPSEHVDVGYIDLLGEDQTIDELAAQAGTIAYELLTSLGARYQRQYINSQ